MESANIQETTSSIHKLVRTSGMRAEFRLQNRLIAHELFLIRKEIKAMATSTLAGLTALQTAVADLTTAVEAETANVQTAVTDISSVVTLLSQNEDPQVQALAALIETQVVAIKAANASLQAASASLPQPAAEPVAEPSPTGAPPAAAEEAVVQAQAADIGQATPATVPLETGKVHFH